MTKQSPLTQSVAWVTNEKPFAVWQCLRH